MKTILIYCQHQLGIGHLTRSLNLAKALVNHFKIVFIQGGPDIGLTINHPSFKHYFLPPIQMTSYSQKFYSPDGDDINDIFNSRINKINELSDLKIDYLLTELFPLGRRKFRTEVLSLIKNSKQKNKSLKVFCSARDILVDPLTDEIVNDLDLYDKILIHSDPKVSPVSIPNLSDKQKTNLRDKLVYTGYVTGEATYSSTRIKNSIIVSVGGGAVGEKQLYTVLECSKLLSEYEFHIVTGINSSAYDDLKKIANGLSNVTISLFKPNLEDLFSQSALSISMGGYNTIMNLASTKTFGLCFAYDENTEQESRIGIFEKMGLVKLLSFHIDPSDLAKVITKNINNNVHDLCVNLKGAQFVQDYLTQGKYEVS